MAVDRSDAEAVAIDDKVLALRSKGRAFSAIAKALGMSRPTDANLAFNRALRRRPAEAQAQIRSDENQRLDRLAVAVKGNETLTEAESHKRLHAIEVLRTRLMAD
jgi:hypothetical protein